MKQFLVYRLLCQAFCTVTNLDHLAHVRLYASACNLSIDGHYIITCSTHRVLEVDECTGMQGQQAHLA